MKKSNKQIIFERMGLGFKSTTNEDEYAERAGQGKGIVSVLVGNIDEAIRYIDEMMQQSPELSADLENIKKRLTYSLENARIFGK